jgi:hypothetical protein
LLLRRFDRIRTRGLIGRGLIHRGGRVFTLLYRLSEQEFNLPVYAPQFGLCPCLDLGPQSGINPQQEALAFSHAADQ